MKRWSKLLAVPMAFALLAGCSSQGEAEETTDGSTVSGDSVVQLKEGELTVDQVNGMLTHLPLELTLVDDENRFVYYNKMAEAEDMLTPRTPDQLGKDLFENHPEEAQEGMQHVLDMLREGEQTSFSMPVPRGEEGQFVVHTYQGIYDENGEYQGIIQYAQDIQPYVDLYLESNEIELPEEATTNTAPAEEDTEEADVNTSASE